MTLKRQKIKANKTAGVVTHYSQYINKESMVPLFKSLVRPILEYGNVVQEPNLRKNIYCIKILHRPNELSA